MPTVDENANVWRSAEPWETGGDQWSGGWGGPDRQWWWSLRPRIGNLLPATTVLEMAPGYGRWTTFLKDRCDRLIIVDLAERCIEACRSRFADETHIEYHVNDGKSLDAVQ